MLKRIHIRGYKSLEDVEVKLSQLMVLFGPNAAGKSNFLDALQLLSKLGTSRTLKEAFDPPYRGKPLESFTIGTRGIKGLLEQDSLCFSIEADLHLSDAIITAVNRQIYEMRRPANKDEPEKENKPLPVRERDLRYRIGVEMLPQSGILRVTDEYLAALNAKGEPTGKRRPFIEGQGRIYICDWKGKRTLPTMIATWITAFFRCRIILRTIRIWWRRDANWKTGCFSILSRVNACGRPIQSRKCIIWV